VEMFKAMQIFHCIKELGTKRSSVFMGPPFLNTRILLLLFWSCL